MPLRIATLILAVFFLLAAVVIFASHGSVSTTVQHNRAVQESFSLAHEYVGAFRAEQGRLPTESEFRSWRMRFPQQAFGPRHVIFDRMEENRPAPEALQEFGPPGPGQTYLLSFWHGEWMDYSPSWTEETSLVVEEADFFFLGSYVHDSLFWATLSVAMVFLSRRVAPSDRSGR